jgi:hypothetical protein
MSHPHLPTLDQVVRFEPSRVEARVLNRAGTRTRPCSALPVGACRGAEAAEVEGC